MRKIVWSMLVSLDGFVEAPDGQEWAITDAEFHDYSAAELRSEDAILFGRVTYQLSRDYWQTAATNPASTESMINFANRINSESLAKIVFSKTLDRVDWNARLVREIVPAEIIALKEQPGQDIAIAGASIGSTLARLGLIDEYELLVQPVVLGSGKPMFAGLQRRINLKLLKTHTFRSGVVAMRYRAA